MPAVGLEIGVIDDNMGMRDVAPVVVVVDDCDFVVVKVFANP